MPYLSSIFSAKTERETIKRTRESARFDATRRKGKGRRELTVEDGRRESSKELREEERQTEK